MSITDMKTVAVAAKKLHILGAKAILIKGGHFKDETDAVPYNITDWLSFGDGFLHPLSHARVNTPNTHGTGCTLSAAIATFLGHGESMTGAVRSAQRYLVQALQESFTPGKGAGPVNFLAGAGIYGG
jgi:hydroxymethylpyrimidine/phosphomethylpyrimidine kinase